MAARYRKLLIRATVIAGVAGVLLGWPMWAAVTWLRYGHVHRESGSDTLLDRYMPVYEVAESHEIRVAAPASITYAAAQHMNLQESPLIRTIFDTRARLLHANSGDTLPSGGIVAQTLALGWGVLAEAPGREIVMGAVTQPWQGNVQFRALPPEAFLPFHTPGYVKIAWTLSVEPVSADTSIFRTRTRVITTDSTARVRFRRYWAIFSPGILLIRHEGLRLVKQDAERQYQGPRPHR